MYLKINSFEIILIAFVFFFAGCAHMDSQAGKKSSAQYVNPIVLKEWRSLAEQGNAQAQTDLGFVYSEGQGVPQDYGEALRWYRLAAEQGEPRAQYNLAILYAHGKGVPDDYVQAHMWSNLAAAQIQGEATKLRGILVEIMTPSQIAEAQRLAREWLAHHHQ